jgi:hypothetical protein
VKNNNDNNKNNNDNNKNNNNNNNNEEKYLRGFVCHEILEIDNKEIFNLLTSREVFEKILSSFENSLENVFCTYIQTLLKKCFNKNKEYVLNMYFHI